jgi:hypothetical protein
MNVGFFRSSPGCGSVFASTRVEVDLDLLTVRGQPDSASCTSELTKLVASLTTLIKFSFEDQQW